MTVQSRHIAKLIKWGGLVTVAIAVWLPVLSCFIIAIAPSRGFAKVDGETIVLGATLSLSGKYATLGMHTKNGYDLAASTINENGGVKVKGTSYKIEIKYYDDQSDPKLGAELAERLIDSNGIKFMLGPYSSALTVAEAPVVEKRRIPMIEANGAAREIFSQGYKYVFGVLSTSDQYLSSVVDLAASLEEKEGRSAKEMTLALIVEEDPLSLDVRIGVIERAKALGIKISADERFSPKFDDDSGAFAKIKSLKPTILIVSGHTPGATVAAQNIRDMKISVPMIAMTQCESADIIKEIGAAAEGILCAAQWAETLKYKGSIFSSARVFSRAYLENYKGFSNAPYQAAEAAAAVVVWKDAFERADTFDTEKLRDALSRTELQTFYGNIKFAPTGQNIAKPMVLRQVQKGKYRVVAPVEWASWPLIYPRKSME